MVCNKGSITHYYTVCHVPDVDMSDPSLSRKRKWEYHRTWAVNVFQLLRLHLIYHWDAAVQKTLNKITGELFHEQGNLVAGNLPQKSKP